MAFGSVGTVTTGFNTGNNQASINIAVANSNLAANNVGVLVVSQLAQTTVASAVTDVVSTVNDSAGNQWIKVKEIQNGSATTMPGIVCSMWYTQARVGLTATSSINVTFETTFVANYDESTLSCWAFSVAGGNTVRVANSTTSVADASSAAGSLDCAVGPTGSYLRFRGIAHNGTVQALTPTVGWTTIGSVISGALVSTCSGTAGEFLISSATTAASAPTKATTVVGFANVYAVFEEVPSIAATQVVEDMFQAGMRNVVTRSY